MKKAIVIGAGIGGIASAIRLAVKGFSVEVFEASHAAGGKLSEIHRGRFRFDAGPSLFTMPQYVDELFRLANKDPRKYFHYQRLENICRYFYEDGTRITAYADKDKFTRELATKTLDPPEKLERYLKRSKKIYDITHPVFLESSLHKISSYTRLGMLRSALHFFEIDPFRTVNEANESYFSDPKTIQFFNRFATYVGSDPYSAPATLSLIPHLEQHFGAFFPEGGMYNITRVLVSLAEELGVKFHYGTPVERILLRDRDVAGIQVGGVTEEAGLVVSNMDVWFTYNKLLPGLAAPGKILRQQRSSSALVFYWGIGKQFEELDLHNVFFSADYRNEFAHIWQQQNISNDPTVYLNISSKFNPADAPAGCENWFTMINVPANGGQDWDELISGARKNILDKLSRNLEEDIEPLIMCEEILDPRGIESNTLSFQGALYGTSSNSRFAAFLRHPNFSSKVANLYFVGGSVHPGGGIPLALLSAKIVDGLIRPF